MAERLNDELVSTYAVRIAGVASVRKDAKKLDDAIRSLRTTQYQPGTKTTPAVTVSQARFGTSRGDRLIGKNARGGADIFVAQVDALEGRVVGATGKAMASAMAEGKRVQQATLRAAVTETGSAGGHHGKGSRKGGPGRDDTGDMIKTIVTNVETQNAPGTTNIVGFHGWQRGRSAKIDAQENGTKGRKSGQRAEALKRNVKKRREDAPPGRGVPAANSLGAAIIIVREKLKKELGALKK